MSSRKMTLGDAARLLDTRSARSRQRKVGASEIGVCRRRAGYTHHGTEPSNPENMTGLAAVVGTWIHKGALDTMRRLWGTVIETRVENDLLRGHVDGIDLPNHLRVAAGLQEHPDAPKVVEVDDLKTRRDGRAIEHVRNRGPKRSELFQVHLYGGLLRQGKVKPIQRQSALAAIGPLEVETVRLRYFPRTGEVDAGGESVEFIHEQPFDTEIEAEAWEWVAQVSGSSKPEDLPRDQNGPGLSIVCDNCPFRTECWDEVATEFAPQSLLLVTDADLARVLADYDDARTDEREAKERKDMARAVLDATNPAIYTDGADLAFKVAWSGGRMGSAKIDYEALLERFAVMQRLYEQAGLEVPQVPYHEPKPTSRSLGLTRWQVPEEPCGKPVGDPESFQPEPESGDVWLQDRPRGGWTLYRVREADGTLSHEQGDLTAGKFAKQFPDYVEPRPGCVLAKRHSGVCVSEEGLVVLDLEEDAATSEVVA